MSRWSHKARVRVAQWLLQLSVWLEPRRDAEFRYALSLVKSAENMAVGTSGEYKHHWVYSRLVQRYPDQPKWKLGLLVEQAVGYVKTT